MMEPNGLPAIHVAAAAKGDVVLIDIVDNGPGIPREARASIFEPFYSTKAAGVGTGLGLTVVQAIAVSHGGAGRDPGHSRGWGHRQTALAVCRRRGDAGAARGARHEIWPAGHSGVGR